MTTALTIVAALGAALVGGVFFAFSSFVMTALARLPATEGIAAMQSINVAVLNPSFLGLFTGTAAISSMVAAIAVPGWEVPSSGYLIAGAAIYLFGTFAVTLLGNVPLNDRLAVLSAVDPASIAIWENYIDRWTRLNTVRAAAATAAALVLVLGLIRRAG